MSQDNNCAYLRVDHSLALQQIVTKREGLAGYHLGLWLVLPQTYLGKVRMARWPELAVASKQVVSQGGT